jgi:hypothetical protein
MIPLSQCICIYIYYRNNPIVNYNTVQIPELSSSKWIYKGDDVLDICYGYIYNPTGSSSEWRRSRSRVGLHKARR